MIYRNKLSPIIKWAGGKTSELKYIHPHIPYGFKNYYEPFVGGGAVYFSLDIDKYYINDMSEDLINLYKVIKDDDMDFNKTVHQMSVDWKTIYNIVHDNEKDVFELYNDPTNLDDFLSTHKPKFKSMFVKDIDIFMKEMKKNVSRKMKRMAILENKKGVLPDADILDNIESSIKSGYYMHIRYMYNNKSKYTISIGQSSAIFFFIRNFAYSGMFRYNDSGEFNVPYGGIGYNSKDLSNKLKELETKEMMDHLSRTTIENKDFEEFLITNGPQEDDFVFLDPPYDCVFSTYDKNEFNRDDQTRLANYLINDCKAKWMVVINKTDFVYKLYDKPSIKIISFDKKYAVNIKNRNKQKVEHLLIKNYD